MRDLPEIGLFWDYVYPPRPYGWGLLDSLGWIQVLVTWSTNMETATLAGTEYVLGKLILVWMRKVRVLIWRMSTMYYSRRMMQNMDNKRPWAGRRVVFHWQNVTHSQIVDDMYYTSDKWRMGYIFSQWLLLKQPLCELAISFVNISESIFQKI